MCVGVCSKISLKISSLEETTKNIEESLRDIIVICMSIRVETSAVHLVNKSLNSYNFHKHEPRPTTTLKLARVEEKNDANKYNNISCHEFLKQETLESYS